MKLLQQNYLKYGLLMSVLTVLCLILMQITDQKPGNSPINILFTFITPFIVWYVGLKAKKKELKNKITFKQGVSESFKISLVYAVISPFIFVFFYIFINPSWIPFVKEAYGLKEASDATAVGVDMLMQFIAAIIGGTLYGAIVSFFLKTKSY